MEEQKVIVDSKKPQSPLDFPQWQWQSDVDPWKEQDPAKWTWQNYSSDACKTIEKAFSENQKTADLENYEINFESMLQINKKSRDRVRRIRKQEKSRFLKEIPQAKIFPQDLNIVEEPRGLMNALLGFVVNQKVLLYVGAALTKEHFDDYDVKKMKYFSWNATVSASKNMNVALEFTKFSLAISQEEKVGVVFVVETDATALQECEGMMDVSEESKYRDEQEVLLAPGTIFELRESRLTENNIYEINVKAMRNSQQGGVLDETVKKDEKPALQQKVTVEKLTLEKMKNLAGTKSMEKLEIKNSEIDEKMMEELERIREKLNLKKENIILMSNTIYATSFSVLGHYYSEDSVNRICTDNKIIFKDGEATFSIKKLVLGKDTLWKFKVNKQLTELCEKIKNEGPHLKSLDLGLDSCGIQDEGMRNLIESLGYLKNLESLNLKLDRNNLSKIENFDDLCKTIESFQSLKSLSLRFSGCILFKDKGLERLQGTLSSLKSTLQELFLFFNECESLTDKGLEQMKKGLGSCKSLKTLYLDFSSCKNISNAGMVHLKGSLIELESLGSLNLTFKDCSKIGTEGLGSLETAVKKMRSLFALSLNFHGCDYISDGGLLFLKAALTPLSSLCFVDLDFAGCESISDTGLNYLKDGLFQRKSLASLSLDFSACGISERGLIDLKDSLIGMESLKSLSLVFSGCPQISSLGLRELKKALMTLRSLEGLTLKFDRCQKISDEGFNDLKTAFAFLPALKKLTLFFGWCEQLSSKAIKYLRGGIIFLNSLEKLCLNFWDSNQISDEGLNQLKPALGSLTNLQELSLTFYNCRKISSKGIGYLKDGLMPLRSLEHLSLDFWNCDQISNEGMGHLKTVLPLLQNLKWISFDFNGCAKISVEGLGCLKDALLELKNLRDVYFTFRNCNNISSGEGDDLKKTLIHIPNFSFRGGIY